MCICVVRDEVDVIAQSLTAALAWADRIGVLDNGSVDGTAEVVRDLAERDDRILYLGSDARPFGDDIRIGIFEALRREARDGDWWCRLDADEFYVGDPRVQLARVAQDEHSVWTASLNYYFTDRDLARHLAEPGFYDSPDVPITDKLRHYMNYWSEPRFFRHTSGLTWRPGDGGFPRAIWSRPASTERVLVRHFPYRSPAQIDKRLATRARDAETSVTFEHENGSAWVQAVVDFRSDPGTFAHPAERVTQTWRDRVVPAEVLDYDDHDGRFVINDQLMPPIPAPRRMLPRPLARVQRAVARVGRTDRSGF
ncbi:glycosyltransferase family 2 protein [Cellulomonas sp. ICMP 17802]|uniref:glycosyltransferase family 2 protein n=1 Tax=Cellulomonas sp. ICMP 17802 TaxID=3239199 RepID=UPI00351AED86